MSVYRVDTRDAVRRIVPLGRSKGVVEVEVMPRIRFAESPAMRSALCLDDIDQGDAPVAIGQTLAIAQRWTTA